MANFTSATDSFNPLAIAILCNAIPSPDNVGDLQMQIQSSLLAVDAMKKPKK
jgi:hypothetical protein